MTDYEKIKIKSITESLQTALFELKDLLMATHNHRLSQYCDLAINHVSRDIQSLNDVK